MNLQQLYYFRTTASLEHYTKAARELNISQSSLSHSITDLENELGVALFIRQGRNVRLTRSGSFFLDYVNKSLDVLDEGCLKLQDFISQDKGNIALSYMSSLSEFVPYLVALYLKETGRIHTCFQFDQGSTSSINAQLISGECDLAFTTLIDDPDIASVQIGSHKTVLVVPPDHPLASRDSVNLTTLQDETFITYDPQCQIRTFFDSIFEKLHMTPHIAFTALSDPIIVGAVSARLGVALMSEGACAERYHTHVLQIENEIPARKIYLAWIKGRYMPPAVKTFRDFIISRDSLLDVFKETQRQDS